MVGPVNKTILVHPRENLQTSVFVGSVDKGYPDSHLEDAGSFLRSKHGILVKNDVGRR